MTAGALYAFQPDDAPGATFRARHDAEAQAIAAKRFAGVPGTLLRCYGPASALDALERMGPFHTERGA